MTSSQPFLFYFIIVFKVYLLLRETGETKREQGRGRERGRHRIRSRLQGQAVNTEPDVGFELTNREIMTWAEVRCLTDWATQVPLNLYFIFKDHYFQIRSHCKVPSGHEFWGNTTQPSAKTIRAVSRPGKSLKRVTDMCILVWRGVPCHPGTEKMIQKEPDPNERRW